MKKALLIASVTMAMAVPFAAAQTTVEINYQNLLVNFSNTGVFTVASKADSSAVAFVQNSGGTQLDSAFINNNGGATDFALAFGANVTNGAGLNDIGFNNGTFAAADNDGVNAALLADFVNANVTGDPDGVSFGSGVLRIEGTLSALGANLSILNSPASPANWVYQGNSQSAIIGNGTDGVANQITVPWPLRDNYSTGVMAVLEISLTQLADGTSTAGMDADTLFAQALVHGGFASSSGQIQLSVIPAPGAAVLGLIGLSLVGWIKRRFA